MTTRWMPDSERDLAEALQDGRTGESHTLEFKRELGRGKGANKELGRDLAQFAIDGGTLIIGVDELDDGGLALTPVELDGLPERIDQVARSVVDPPLAVSITTLPSTDAQRGYLFVTVPESPDAPHAVDGRFYGRGDRTKHVLTKMELEQVLRQRLAAQEDVEEHLADWVARDPVPDDTRAGAHLFVLARPSTARRGMLHDHLRSEGVGDLPHVVRTAILDGRPRTEWAGGQQFAPDIPNSAGNGERRPDGWAFHSNALAQGRAMRRLDLRSEEGTLDLEVTEDGEIRLFCGRAAMSKSGTGEFLFIFEALILGLVKRTLLVASNVSEVTGYVGPWDVAVALNGLAGHVSHRESQGFLTGSPYASDTYGESVRVTSAQLVEEADIDAVVERLVGRLNRTLNGGVVPVPQLP